MILNYFVLDYIQLYCIRLNYIILYYIKLYYMILHYIILHYIIVSLEQSRLSYLPADIIIMANSMGLIPKTGEQHLIENNNINHNKHIKQRKTKQHKQYNRL